ncbi:hypothetical protein BDAP_002603 [Binucleata daphniae]
MKNKSRYAIYSVFGITMMIIAYELFNITLVHANLTKGKLGLPENSSSYSLAAKDPMEYIKSQLMATHSKFRAVIADLLKHTLFIFIALLFLNRSLQKAALKVSEKRITFINDGFRDLKRVEINYMCLVFLCYLTSVIIVSMIKSKNLDFYKLGKYTFMFLGFYFFIAPIAIFVIYMALFKFHKKFIIACYVAYVVKVLPELIMDDQVDNIKMVKMNMDEFPEDIQEVLKKYDLTESVYKERTPGDDLNAALIGYGSGKRMEIYGDPKTFGKQELYAVFLHEVGHVDEHSLVRKSAVYFTVLFVEMFLILWIYDKLSAKYTNETISFFTSFILLFFIYRILIRQWPMTANKMASQMSEINSDLFAKGYGYSDALSATLFDIGISSHDYLKPTFLYNSIRSTHPSIFSRVEYLIN